MFTTNPFAELSAFVSPAIMQAYVVVAALLVSLSPILVDRVISERRVEAAAREIADTMRQARGFAIRDNRSQFVTIDVGARVAAIGGTRTQHRLPDEAQIRLIVADVEQVNAEAGRIRFFPDGTSTGGKVVITSTQQSLAVVVDWFDGRVRLVGEPAS